MRRAQPSVTICETAPRRCLRILQREENPLELEATTGCLCSLRQYDISDRLGLNCRLSRVLEGLFLGTCRLATKGSQTRFRLHFSEVHGNPASLFEYSLRFVKSNSVPKRLRAGDLSWKRPSASWYTLALLQALHLPHIELALQSL